MEYIYIFIVFQRCSDSSDNRRVGYRVHKGMIEGNAWWTGKIKVVIEGKSRACKKMLQGMWLGK